MSFLARQQMQQTADGWQVGFGPLPTAAYNPDYDFRDPAHHRLPNRSGSRPCEVTRYCFEWYQGQPYVIPTDKRREWTAFRESAQWDTQVPSYAVKVTQGISNVTFERVDGL